MAGAGRLGLCGGAMIKLILLVCRKPGMNREAFKTYYESTHAPLAASLMHKCTKYVRNFVSEELTGPLDFDVITEFWFDVDGPWEEAHKSLTDAAARQSLEHDEERFMDRSSMRVFVSDERVMEPKRLLGQDRQHG
jgi:uncharacterized protein (TIGR02118 family)